MSVSVFVPEVCVMDRRSRKQHHTTLRVGKEASRMDYESQDGDSSIGTERIGVVIVTGMKRSEHHYRYGRRHTTSLACL